MKTLIINNLELIQEKIAGLLKKNGQSNITLKAKDFSETVCHLEKSSPELIILDIDIPNGMGIKILRNIKKILPNTKIIVLYSYYYDKYLIKLQEIGADYLISYMNSS